MAKVITKQVKGKSEIDGLEVTKCKNFCENCGSENVFAEGSEFAGGRITGWTCGYCEISFKNQSKTKQTGKNSLSQERHTVSIEQRAETIAMDKDIEYLTTEISYKESEFNVYMNQLPATKNQFRFLKLFIAVGSLTEVAKITGYHVTSVRESMLNIGKKLDYNTVKAELYPDYSAERGI